MGVLLNAAGTPEPPTEIVRGLRNLHPSYGLRYMMGEWKITWEWPERDPRWERVQKNEIPRESAFDIIGSLPLDCPLNEARAYVERSVKDYPIEEVRKHIANMQRWNSVEVPKAQTETLVADTLDSFAQDQRQQNPGRKRVVVERGD